MHNFRVFATCDIGPALDLLRTRGYQLEVYQDPKAPPESLVLEKVRSGIDGLITTLRDQIDAEVFEAGKETLKVVAQFADRKSTRLNSSHQIISYAVFCLKKKKM